MNEIPMSFLNLNSLLQVDCTEAGKETCGKHGVSGYPTLKIFRNGKVSQDYDGPRDSGMLLFVLYIYIYITFSGKKLL